MFQGALKPTNNRQLKGNFSFFLIKILLQYRPDRFLPSTVAHSGSNPQGPYESFFKKDPVRCINVRKDEKPRVDVEKDYGFMKGKVPTGTQTYTFLTGKLNQSGGLDRSGVPQRDVPRNKTDHVSYDPPTSTRPH